jgi:hypothetical protein
MARAASPDIVVLGSRRKARLEAIVRRASSPQALARRARIVLLAHAGWPNARIAAELGCAVNTVRTWRRRFARGGLPSLCDRPRSGRPEVYGPDIRLAIGDCHLGPARGRLGAGPCPDRRAAGRDRHLGLPGRPDPGRPGTTAAPGPGLAEPPR